MSSPETETHAGVALDTVQIGNEMKPDHEVSAPQGAIEQPISTTRYTANEKLESLRQAGLNVERIEEEDEEEN